MALLNQQITSKKFMEKWIKFDQLLPNIDQNMYFTCE